MDNYPRLLFDDFSLRAVRLIFEGGVSSTVDSMHDVMRRGEGGHVTAHDDIIFYCGGSM